MAGKEGMSVAAQEVEGLLARMEETRFVKAGKIERMRSRNNSTLRQVPRFAERLRNIYPLATEDRDRAAIVRLWGRESEKEASSFIVPTLINLLEGKKGGEGGESTAVRFEAAQALASFPASLKQSAPALLKGMWRNKAEKNGYVAARCEQTLLEHFDRLGASSREEFARAFFSSGRPRTLTLLLVKKKAIYEVRTLAEWVVEEWPQENRFGRPGSWDVSARDFPIKHLPFDLAVRLMLRWEPQEEKRRERLLQALFARDDVAEQAPEALAPLFASSSAPLREQALRAWGRLRAG